MTQKKLRFQLGALGVALVILTLAPAAFGQVVYQKVGNNPTTINASAQMEVESTTKGFLPPRMTNAQMIAIIPSATNNGLVVYSTTANATTGSPIGLYTVNNSNGTWAWEYIGSKQMIYSAITAATANLATNSAGAAYTLDATANNIVVTLPEVTASNKGQSIEVVRIDNSSTYSTQIAAYAGEYIGSGTVSSLYLYGQNEAVTLRNDGTSRWYIVSDNRTNNGVVSKSFVSVIANTAQGSIGDTNPIQFNVKEATFGSDITINQGSSPYTSFTLKAGKVYRLYGTPGNAQTISSRLGFQWRQTSGTAAWIGVSGNFIPGPDSYNAPYGSQPAVATVAPASDITVSLCYNQSATGGGSLPSAMNSFNFAAAYIEVIGDAPGAAPSSQMDAYGTIDYINVKPTTTTTISAPANGGDITFDSKISGNLVLASNAVTLIAGKTYKISTSLELYIWGVAGSVFNIGWTDVGTSGTTFAPLTSGSTLNGGYDRTPGFQTISYSFIYTPSTNQSIKFRCFGSGTNVNNLNVYPGQTSVSIEQIGTSALTTVPQAMVEPMNYTSGEQTVYGWRINGNQVYARRLSGTTQGVVGDLALFTPSSGSASRLIDFKGWINKANGAQRFPISSVSAANAPKVSTIYQVVPSGAINLYVGDTDFYDELYDVTVYYTK